MWFIIEYKNVLYGSFYLTKQNNISINLIKKNQNVYRRVINFIIKNIKPLPSIPSVRPGMFTVNFSVKNKDYVNIVQQIGGVKVQETYILNANR